MENKVRPRDSFIVRLRRFGLYGGAMAGLAAVGGLAVAASGIIDIGASSGHIFVVQKLLPFVRSRSVSLHARAAPEPTESLDSAAMVERGALHYAAACVNCHGAPGVEQPLYTDAMLPPAPHLARSGRIEDRRSDELYFVVQHGIKASGMPAWTTRERTDEAWSVVAFLEQMPKMSARRYRELAGLDETSMQAHQTAAAQSHGVHVDVLDGCARCHGYDGRGSESGAVPNLTMQTQKYLRLSLHAYADDQRHSGIMTPQVHDLPDGQLDALAAYYAQQPLNVVSTKPSPELAAAGRAIANEGIEVRDLAACESCHGILEETPTEKDDSRTYYPRLAGQYAPYLRAQLHAWASGLRGGALREDPTMAGAHALEPDEIEAVSAHYASLGEPRYSMR